MSEAEEEIMKLMREHATALAENLAPDCYGSATQDLYAHKDEELQQHFAFSLAQQWLFLKDCGLCGKALRSGELSEVDTNLARSNKLFRVDYIGKIDWLADGVQRSGKQRIYNLEGSSLLPLVKTNGATPVIEAGLKVFLGDQVSRVKGWLKQGYQNLEGPAFNRPSLTLILLGKFAQEGRRLQELLTFLLGGKAVDPSIFMSRPGLGIAHAQLAEATHWVINAGLKNAEAYRKFILAEELLFIGKGGTSSVPLPFGALKTIFVERIATELKKLPPLCFGLKEKVIVLGLPSVDDFSFDLAAAKAELGSFVNSVLASSDAPVAYQARETEELLFETSLAGEFYRMLCALSINSGAIKGEAEIGQVFGNNVSFRDRRNWEKESTGALLETIAYYRPLEVVKLDNGYWKFNLPTTEHEQPSSFDQ